MNVYVRELVSALAQAGVDCTTYTRKSRPGLAEVVQVEPGHRVVHLPAGPFELAKQDLPNVVEEFGDGVIDHLKNGPGADVVHANYWLSGLVAHRVKHELDLPFVSTFHTLARVKAEGGDAEPVWRDRAEAEIIDCADAICVSCTAASTAALAEGSRSSRQVSSTRSSLLATSAGRATRSASAPARCCCSSVGSNR